MIDLRNDGPVAATGLDLTLSADTPGIAIEDGVSSIDDIPAGGTGQNSGDPFAFGIDSAMQDSLATLWVRAGTGSNARQGAIRLDLRIGRPDEVTSTELILSPCYPNPFGGGTNVSFNMPAAGRAVVRVYDVSGRLVKTVADSFLEAGPQESIWHGTNRNGDAVAAGVYFVSVETAGDSRTRKVVLLR